MAYVKEVIARIIHMIKKEYKAIYDRKYLNI
ncbi:hypothetical protein QOZ91_003407 [Clostridium sardiniense]|nr:hypothetical protein [Clostridium sardiniense]